MNQRFTGKHENFYRAARGGQDFVVHGTPYLVHVVHVGRESEAHPAFRINSSQ